VTDDPRALLAGLPTAKLRPMPPGHVAILRAGAVEAGADEDALDAWVRENGGRVRKAPPIRSSGMRAGRVTAQTQPGEAYYVVPAALLAE
jgi:hypothetical protein